MGREFAVGGAVSYGSKLRVMKGSTILYVDNDPASQAWHRQGLEREGFQVDCAQDGIEALEKAVSTNPDLILLDLELPTMGGADVLRFLRAEPSFRLRPVLVYTNANRAEVPEEIPLDILTQFLRKSDCAFSLLLQCIKDGLSGMPSEPSQPERQSESSSGDNLPPATVSATTFSPGSETETPGQADSLATARARLPGIRKYCCEYVKSPNSPTGRQHLTGLHESTKLIGAEARQLKLHRLDMIATALDRYLFELRMHPDLATPGALKTVVHSVDCLDFVVTSGESPGADTKPRPKVLAVDDDAVFIHVMDTILKRANFQGKCVPRPADALEVLRAEPHDLILLDVEMPGMNGFELCRKIRQLEHCQQTPVVFITAHNNFGNRAQSVLSGAKAFMAKPVTSLEMTLRIVINLLMPQAQPAGNPGQNSTANRRSPSSRPVLATPPVLVA